MKMKLSPLVLSMRGKVGNGVASVWKGIQVMRQMPATISQPNSSEQMFLRQLMNQAKQAYDALSVAEKAAYETYAGIIAGFALPPGGIDNLVPVFGGTPMSGYNAFIACSMGAALAGMAMPTVAPLVELRPSAPTVVTAIFAAGTVTVTWNDPLVAEAGAQIRIWMRSKSAVYHKQLINFYALAVETAAITSAKSRHGNTIPFTADVDDETTFQLDTINPSGARSEGSMVVKAIVA